MTKNISVLGEIRYRKAISDLRPGEEGYTAPWAYNPNTGELNTTFAVEDEPSGPFTMFVRCTTPGNFEIDPGQYLYSR